MDESSEVRQGLAYCFGKLRFREVVYGEIVPSNKSREQVRRGNPYQAVCFGGLFWILEVELWCHRFIVVRVGLPHFGRSPEETCPRPA